MVTRFLKVFGILSVLVIITVSVLGMMAFTKTGFVIINDGERGVMKSGTRYDMTEMNPGYHFFIPVYQSVEVNLIRPKLINYSKTEGAKTDSTLLLFEPMLEGVDKKGIPISMALSIEVEPVSDKLAEMYKSDGDFDNSFYKKVLQVNRDAVQSTISSFEADTIMDRRTIVEKTLNNILTVSYARNPYFKLVQINLKDIVVPEKIREKQIDVQLAKQDALRSSELIVKAENEAKSVEAKALGDANAMKLRAKGKAESILIEASAQEKANIMIANSVTPEVIQVQAINAWQDGGSQVPQVGGVIPFIGKIEDLKDLKSEE